jgi:uncharacterized iron-regulated protein
VKSQAVDPSPSRRYLPEALSLRHGALVLALAVFGCASETLDAQVGRTAVLAPERAPAAKKGPEREALPADVVERAALPYHGVRLADRQPLEPEELYRELERADVICVGEEHDDPHHHYAQLEVARHLADRSGALGRQLGFGFEMFQRHLQEPLNDYASRKLSEEKLLAQTEWDKRWNMDFALYRPLVELGRERGAALLALNAASEVTRQIAKKGLDSLGEPASRQLPELDLDDAEHRAAFDRAMRQHPHSKAGGFDNYYAAQVVWDETMADAVADWLKGAFPARQAVVFAGINHCADWAIPSRIRRRMAARTVSVLPVQDAAPEQQNGYGYAFVMSDDE